MGSKEPEKKRLSICPLEIYDSTLGVWPKIGVKSSYSDTLLKNISASVIADHSGLASVDYVKRKHLNDWKRNANLDPGAFDLATIHFLDTTLIELRKHIVANSHNLIYSDIQVICDLTLAKGIGTLRVALDLSSKGLLHEVLAVCRSSLEMVMWALTTFDLPNDKDPFEFLPERAVSGFKAYFPYAGRYYSYLSGFLHWRKESHSRAFRFDEEGTAILYQSLQNKWEAVANIILMARVYAEGYITKYSSLKCKQGRQNCLPKIENVSKKIEKKQIEWLRFLTEVDDQHLSASFADILVSIYGL